MCHCNHFLKNYHIRQKSRDIILKAEYPLVLRQVYVDS